MASATCNLIQPKTAANFMAVLTILRALGCLLCTSGFLLVYIYSKDTILNFLDDTLHIYIEFPYLTYDTVVRFTALLISVFTFEIPLYSSLAYFIYTNNRTRCRHWWKTKCILLAVSLGAALVLMLMSEDRLIIGIVIVLTILYDAFLIEVTREFANENKILTDQEVALPLHPPNS